MKKEMPDLEVLKYHGTKEEPDIKIFVSHRIDMDSQTIDNPLYIPVRCGAVFDDRENIDMLGDDTGDSISEKRMMYGELTVQYWAWKNVDSDYYGLCHYRRYLSFLALDDIRDENGQVHIKCINEKNVSRLGLDTEFEMRGLIYDYDVLVSEKFDVSKKGTPNGFGKTVFEHWKKYEGILIENTVLNSVEGLIKEKYPQYLNAYKKYMNSKMYLGYNCFIMKKALFRNLCDFQFDILFELERNLDMGLYSENMLRTLGFVGEILYATYITFLEEKRVRVKYLPLTIIEYANKYEKIKPIFESNYVTIVLMSSNYYAPIVATFILSLLEYSNENINYDIIILEKEISCSNKKKLEQIVEKYENVSLRFYNPCYEVGDERFYIAHEVYAEEAYYRMITPWILCDYDKAIVLDSDIVLQSDISELYHIDIEEYLAAGVRDVVFQGILNGSVPGTYEYVKNEMGMREPYDYVNTGVMVLNLKEWRKQYTLDEIIKIATSKKFRIQEQDILNVILEGKILFLDYRWNYYVGISDFLKQSLDMAPYKAKQKYNEAGKNPYLIHYAGVPKPWNSPSVDLGEKWWHYTLKSPYYSEIIYRRIGELINYIESRCLERKKSYLRRYIDYSKEYGVKSAIRHILDKTILKIRTMKR